MRKPKKPYQVRLTETAERVYVRVMEEGEDCIEAGDVTNAKVKRYRLLDEILEKIIPHEPFSKERALSGPLSNIFRIKKGRMRVCYIGSSAKHEIVVLYISDTLRKEGDARDPYSVFTKLVTSGEFDEVFAMLGVKAPTSIH